MLNQLLLELKKVAMQLFPGGRAFRVAKGSVKEKIVEAVNISQAYFAKDADSVLNHILPDNDGFTEYDAELWEQRLGINSNPNTSLEDRKAAIIQKLNHPGNILARQSGDFIQQQLQLAGFNVFVYRNPNGNDPNIVFGVGINGIATHSDGVYHMSDELYHGDINLWYNVVANSIDETTDSYFDVGDLVRTFFICGNPLGTFASVPESRKEEFRQLILQLKPARSIAYLGINYI